VFRGERVLLLQALLVHFSGGWQMIWPWRGRRYSRLISMAGTGYLSRRRIQLSRTDGRLAEVFRGPARSVECRCGDAVRDCRPIHKLAHEIAHRRGLKIGVFEEGYIRPDYVTLEQFGVNYHSRIPRKASYYMNIPIHKIDRPIPLGNTYWYAVLWQCFITLRQGCLSLCFDITYITAR